MNEPARSIISKVSPTRHLVPARRIVSTHFRSRPTPNCTVLHGCVQVNQHAKRRKLMPQVPAQGLPREPCLSQEKRRKRRPLQPSLHFERRPSCQTQAEVRRIPTTTDALCMTCPHRRAQEGTPLVYYFWPVTVTSVFLLLCLGDRTLAASFAAQFRTCGSCRTLARSAHRR